MENKFITTGEMLKKYKLLESHFPPSSFKIYTPSAVEPVNGAYTDKQLSAEAVKMLEIVMAIGGGDFSARNLPQIAPSQRFGYMR